MKIIFEKQGWIIPSDIDGIDFKRAIDILAQRLAAIGNPLGFQEKRIAVKDEKGRVHDFYLSPGSLPPLLLTSERDWEVSLKLEYLGTSKDV